MSPRGWLWVAIPVAILVLAVLIVRRRRGVGDIQWPSLPADLKWGDAAEACLSRVHEYALGFCNSSIAWYQNRRRSKRVAGFALRAGALLATAGAGLVPLAADLKLGTVPPPVSTVLIAMAGLFISIDTLGGFTSGWIRYMLAQQKIERLRDGFLLDWQRLRLAADSAPAFLERARMFVLAVGKVLDDETQEWATEFQNALKDLERARKTEAESQRTGAIEITVRNHEVVTSWTLEIDGSQRGHTSGRTLALTDVLIGLHKARAFGTNSAGRVYSQEAIITVAGGATVTKELELT